MKEFEERQRELFRSHLKTNIAAFASTSDATMTILSTKTLVGRLDATSIASSLSLARQPAWASISTNLNNQLKSLVKDTASFLGTQHGVVTGDLRANIDMPILGRQLWAWLGSAEVLEGQRVLKAMRAGYGLNLKPLDTFKQHAPYSISNSAVGAITVTAATSVMNRVALEIFELAGIRRYKLETQGDVRVPKAYTLEYSTSEEPQAPMFIGDRSYPVPA